jgi:hypothetical protein
LKIDVTRINFEKKPKNGGIPEKENIRKIKVNEK